MKPIRILNCCWLAVFLTGPSLTAIDTAADTAADAAAEERKEYIRSHYSKFEARIPMRDGVRLFTAIYVPNQGEEPYPFLMMRTPYSVRPYGSDRYKKALGPHVGFEQDGFIFVFQDVRGRYMSEGEFVNMRPHKARKASRKVVDESTDTYDTIEWLLANVPEHNGKVGQWGNSYPGFYTAAGAIDSHPALKAISPQAPIADWFWDDMHRHGAFVLPLAFNFFSSFGKARDGLETERPDGVEHGTADGYSFFHQLGPLKNVNELYFKGEIDFWNKLTEHPNYDEFWQSRNILPHLKGIQAAVMVVGGWYDTEDLYGPLKIYRSIEEKNAGIHNTLVMGPWPHGGWNRVDGDSLGTARFGWKTSHFYREQVDLPFFRHYLKDEGELDLPEALVFETGANRWRELSSWPPPGLQEKSLYLQREGGLSFAPPDEVADEEAYDDYVSDPAKPVPYTMEITTRWARNYMTEDQRFAAWRPDVLVYQGEVLAEDLTLAGPLVADLWVSTTGTAADWVVKIIDVFPGEHPDAEDDEELTPLGGQQRLVRGEAFRGRFRNSYEHPEPFIPGQPSKVSFELHDIFHTFKRGHRLMLHIQSSWFPLIDRNPQKYVPNIFTAEAEDFVRQTHTVHRSERYPSRIRVGVLPGLGMGADENKP